MPILFINVGRFILYPYLALFVSTCKSLFLKLERQALFSKFIFISREQIIGNAEGELNVGAVNARLKASLDKLSAECNDISDIAINYYATDLPDKLPTTMEDLVSVIENFPSRLKKLNDGKGIPMKVRFCPENLPNTHNVIQDVFRIYLPFIYYSWLRISKY